MTRLEQLAEQAATHSDAAHAIAELLDGPVPAPAAYRLIATIKNSAGWVIAQSLSELAVQLEASLAQSDVDHVLIDAVTTPLVEAADLAHRLGRLLDTAQTAISTQGFYAPDVLPEVLASR